MMSNFARCSRFPRSQSFDAVVLFIFFVFSIGTKAQANRDSAQIANFTDIAGKSGLTIENVFGGKETKKYIIETTGTGVAIFDYDNDGWPDIFIVNGTTLEGSPPGKGPTSHLYRNNHDGTFKDVTVEAGVIATGWGQGVCVGYYDNDGWEDLYVTYYGKNRLYHNQKGVFTEVAQQAGVAGAGKSWGTGCAFVDYDRDRLLDLIVANYVDFDLSTAPAPGARASCVWKGVPVMCGPRGLPGAKNILYRNRGNGTFEDVTVKAHLDRTDGHYSLGISTLDFDADGWPDIYVACDSTPSILYHNNRDGTFTDISASAGVGITSAASSRGLAVGDLWNDGKLSVVISNMNSPPSLLVNQIRSSNHWIGIQTVGTRSNRDGIGAGITVNIGKRRLVDEVRSGSSYISNSDRRVHFGLGTAERVDSVQVRWPSGLVEQFNNVTVDSIHSLTEGSGVAMNHATPKNSAPSISR